MSYCQVIVDLTAVDVDRLFTYRIPAGMILSPGQRVLVPFGPRKLEGFVIALTPTSELEEEKIKDVIRPLEDYPLILPEMIDLARHLRETCHSTMASALRLMIPPQMRGDRVRAKTVEYAHLLIEGDKVDEALAARRRAKRQAQVIEDLAKGGPLPASAFSRQALKALEKAGVVALERREALRTPTPRSTRTGSRRPG